MKLSGLLHLRRRGEDRALPCGRDRSLRYVINAEATAEAVAEVRESVGWEGRADRYRAALPASYCYACCFDGLQMVGFGRAISDGVDDAVIFDLAVRPEYQHAGIASTLVDAIVAYCAEHRVKAVSVLFEPQLARFYHRRGFLQICGGVIDTEVMSGPWRGTADDGRRR